MKDIDFDELDRAVSSLLGGTKQKSDPATTEVKQSVVEVPARNTSDDERPAPAVTVETNAGDDTQEEAAIATKPKTFVNKRSGGRFMDVMHPSHDMSSERREVKKAPTRKGVDLSPVNNDAIDSVVETAPATPEENQDVKGDVELAQQPETNMRSATSAATPSRDDSANQHTPMPDPLDFHGFAGESSEDTETVGSELSDDQATDTTDKELSDALAEELARPDDNSNSLSSMESPFLMTKVEKRPLGGPHLEEAKEDQEASPSIEALDEDKEPASDDETTIEEISEEKRQDDEEQKAPEVDELPNELYEDLVDIEARDLETLGADGKPEAEKPATALDGEAKDRAADPAPVPMKEAAAPVTVTAVGGGSISQQYKTKEVAADAEPTSIYDTDDYHQALKHPEKKSSGWLHAFLIVLLIAIGAGGGAAVYFFVLN